jgi:hypothetical protein
VRACALLVLVACTHVKLEVPPPDAPLPERVKAYQALRPLHREDWRVADAPRIQWTRSLVLANGLEVVDPEDLSPAVHPGSPTAEWIGSYEKKNKPWKVLAPLAACSFALGATVAAYGLGVLLSGHGHDPGFVGPSATIALYASAPLIAGIPLIAVVIGFLLVPDSDADRLHAFESYHADLKAFLGVEPP